MSMKKAPTTSTDEDKEVLGTESNKKRDATAPVDVTSIITQVDRDAPAHTMRQKRPQPAARRGFLSRLLCCAPKPGAGAQQHISLVMPSTPSFMMHPVKKAVSYPPRVMESQELASISHFLVADGGVRVRGKKCLALDLDETLVHSSFQPVDCSFTIDVVIDGVTHNIYVIKRPGVDAFLTRLAEYYDLLIYTASLSKYADPLLDLLDTSGVISRRLFRENCVFYDGHYVKDLSLLSTPISQTIIVDNCPTSYIFHPENAIDCSSFFDDPADVELWQIADFLISIHHCDDVRAYCRTWREWCKLHPSSIPPPPVAQA